MWNNFNRLLYILFITLSSCISKATEIDSVFILDFESNSITEKQFFSYTGEPTQKEFHKGNGAFVFPNKGNDINLNFNFKPKKIYKVSCWTKGNVTINCTIKYLNEKIRIKENLSYKKEKGWEKIELLVNTAWWDTSLSALINVKNTGKKEAFIDDLIIEEILGATSDYSFEINKKNVIKLVGFRNNAVHSPYIKAKNKRKIKAKLNRAPVIFKLKGDWTDHVKTGVWSFKMFGKKPIVNDLKTLTFQNVKTRNLMKEWTFIRLCKAAGIVTPKYDFVNVSINKGTAYICALEENFSDNFIYRKRGYSAPVLRLYEDFLFPHWVYGWGHKKVDIPEINHSYIYCFDTKKYSSDKFKKEFDNAASKLKQFIKEDSVIHLVDQEKWSEFLAIQALTKSYHNLTWHNTRWFVNKKGLIEPIAYDGNTENGKTEHWFGGLYGDLNRYLNSGSTVAVNFNNKLFMNAKFMALYKKKLDKYSNKLFLDERLASFSKEMEESLRKIQVYYDYNYSTDYLYASANKLKKSLKNLNNSKWYGKEHIFNIDFNTGKAPFNQLYAVNLIRGYTKNGNLLIINGTSEQIEIYKKNNKNPYFIDANGELTLKYLKDDKWVLEVEGNEIELPIVSWVPLK